MRKLIATILLMFPLLLSACGSSTPTQDPAVIKTEAAQTVDAVLALTAMAVKPTSTATPAIPSAATSDLATAETPQPTNTPLITDTPALTTTPFINPTRAATLPYSCDQYLFIDDITIPDGEVIQPGATFVKTWRIQNTGSCVWTPGYQLVFGYGGEGTDWSKVAPVNFPNDVAQGGLMDISVTLTAPTTSGSYGAYFRPRNEQGTTFGEFIWVFIQVP